MILTNMTNWLKNMTAIGCNIATLTSGKMSESQKVDGLFQMTNVKNEVISTVYATTNYVGAMRAPFSRVYSSNDPSSYSNFALILDENINVNKDSEMQAIGFGSGSTPVQESDYKLDSFISSGLSRIDNDSYAKQNIVVDEDRTKVTRTAEWRATVKNSSSNPITIKEVGFYQATNSDYYVLLHRDVLENPAILEAGAIATFTYKFVFTNTIV